MEKETKIFTLIIALVLSIAGYLIYIEIKYPCIKGHYEEQYVSDWIYDNNGNIIPMGGHYEDVYICDER